MHRPLIVIVAAVAVLGLAGCSKAAQSAPLSGTLQTSAVGGAAGAAGGNPDGRGQFPGVSGLVAAVTGSTAQVQGANQQTAVTWRSTTRFTDQVAASASALAVKKSSWRDRPGPREACLVAPRQRGDRPPRERIRARDVRGRGLGRGASRSRGAPARPAASGRGTGRGRPRRQPRRAVRRPASRAEGRAAHRPGVPGAGAGGRVGTPSAPWARSPAVGVGQFTVSPAVRPGATRHGRPVSVTYTSSTVFTRLSRGERRERGQGGGVPSRAQGRTDDTGALTAVDGHRERCRQGAAARAGSGGRGPGGGRGAGGGAGNGGWEQARGGATSTAGAGNAHASLTSPRRALHRRFGAPRRPARGRRRVLRVREHRRAHDGRLSRRRRDAWCRGPGADPHGDRSASTR